MIDLSVTFGDFPSRFLKCSFHIFIHSSWLVAFSFALGVTLPSTLFIYSLACYSKLSIFNCISNFIDLALNVFYLGFFLYILISSLCAVLIFWVLAIIRFLLLHRDIVFTLSHFLFTINVSHRTLCLALSLISMHSAPASMWELTKFSYSWFGISVSDISWSASNLFLSVIVYLLLSKDHS